VTRIHLEKYRYKERKYKQMRAVRKGK